MWSIFFILLALSTAFYLIKQITRINRDKKLLLEKLYEMEDYKTLSMIGETDLDGNEYKRRVIFATIWLEHKYNETHDEVYSDLEDLLSERTLKFLVCWLIIGISAIIAFALF